MAIKCKIEDISLDEYKNIVNETYGFDIINDQVVDENFLKKYHMINNKYILFQRSFNSKIKKICCLNLNGNIIYRCTNPSSIELDLFERQKRICD